MLSLVKNIRRNLRTFNCINVFRTFSDYKVDTQFVKAGCEFADPTTGAIIPPLHFSTNFERNTEGELPHGHIYSRISNPTRKLLETTFTSLEGGKESFAFSSGMQAATSLLMSCPGAHVILPNDLYHGVSYI
jgi:cystathionine gamma-synthase